MFLSETFLYIVPVLLEVLAYEQQVFLRTYVYYKQKVLLEESLPGIIQEQLYNNREADTTPVLFLIISYRP